MPNGPTVNKTQFILGQPPVMSAADVVRKAKEQGFTLSTAMVYTVRSQAKHKGNAPKGKPGPKPRGMQSLAAEGHDAERTIRRLALLIGLTNVEAIVKKIRKEAGL